MSEAREKYLKAKDHLLSLISEIFPENPESVFMDYANEWTAGRNRSFDSASVFAECLFVIMSKTNFSDVIGDGLQTALNGFSRDPAGLLERFPEWYDLTDHIAESGVVKGNVARHLKALDRLERGDMRNTWVSACRSVHDAAELSLRYQNNEDVLRDFETNVYVGSEPVSDHEFVAGKCDPEESCKVLFDISDFMFGIGPSLAAEIAVRLGRPWFVRPDAHSFELLPIFDKFAEEGKPSPKELVRAGSKAANAAGIHPHALDRLMFLSVSGNLYRHCATLRGTAKSRAEEIRNLFPSAK